jgi:hypothetical protein
MNTRFDIARLAAALGGEVDGDKAWSWAFRSRQKHDCLAYA